MPPVPPGSYDNVLEIKNANYEVETDEESQINTGSLLVILSLFAARCIFLYEKVVLRKQYSAAQKVKKVQYWVFET